MDEGENKEHYHDLVSAAGFQEVFHFVPVSQIYLLSSNASGGPPFMFFYIYGRSKHYPPPLHSSLHTFQKNEIEILKGKGFKGKCGECSSVCINKDLSRLMFFCKATRKGNS
jgi:hypothetical protein